MDETKLFQLEVPAIIHSDLSRKKGGSLKYDLYSKRSSLAEREPADYHKYKWSSVRLGRRESVVKIDTSANGGPFPATQQPIKVIGKEVTALYFCPLLASNFWLTLLYMYVLKFCKRSRVILFWLHTLPTCVRL